MTTEKKTQQNNSRTASGTSLRELWKKLVMRAVFSVVTLLLAAVLFFSLTAAWFTNVADTGGLTFTAKNWGFDGEIAIDGGAALIAPGAQGVVSMRIANTGTENAIAGVSVSKANASDTDKLMQQRLYFYVDTPFYRNGERMSRVYVTENGGYTYAVPRGTEIVISDGVKNVPLLRYTWVYDVLGYYVRGEVTDGQFRADEYLRPIEYEYDAVRTTFDENGRLATVDGEKSAGAFLAELSATDGYAGEIDAGAVTADGYYPVSVNAEGYGVYAYLCTYEEILANTAADTQMGTDASVSYSVEIRVTGSNTEDTAIAVDSAEMLSTLLSTVGQVGIRLTQDVTLSEPLTLTAGQRADIDLGGNTLHLANKGPISLAEGASLCLTNGTLSGDGQLYALEMSGAELMLDDVVIRDVTYGMKIADHQNGMGTDSRVQLVDSHVAASSIGVWIYGNGGEGTMTTVLIENSTIEGTNYAGVVCNGSYSGTNIQVKNSTLTGYYTALYHPQKDSTLLIENSRLSGFTGLVIKGGTVAVHDCIIQGTGTLAAPVEPTYSLSGFCDTGDGIYLETNYEWSIEVTVTGKNTRVTAASGYAYAVRKYAADDAGAVIFLHEGSYSTDVSAFLAVGAVQAEDGSGGYTVSMKQ